MGAFGQRTDCYRSSLECDERTARGEGRGAELRILQERAWEPRDHFRHEGHERNCVLVRAYWLPHGE